VAEHRAVDLCDGARLELLDVPAEERRARGAGLLDGRAAGGAPARADVVTDARITTAHATRFIDSPDSRT